MEQYVSKSETGSAVFDAPILQKKPAYTLHDMANCAVSYVSGWLFIRMFAEPYWQMLLLALVMMIWVLFTGRDRRGGREHWLWLVCLWSSVLFLFHSAIGKPMNLFGLPEGTHVWSDGFGVLMIPVVLLPYWVLSRNGLLSGGGSSGWFLLDLWNACLVLPFRRIFERIRVMVAGMELLRDKLHDRRIGYGLITLGLALVFLMIALALMVSADAGFAALFTGVSLPAPDGWFVLRLLLSLPVGACFYSIVAGGAALDTDFGTRSWERLANTMRRTRLLPACCWLGVMAGFSLLYLVFFCVQGRELLQVLRSMLAPGDETMAQYAVRGFLEMCLLITLNTALLMTAMITSAPSIRHSVAGKALMTVLQAENLLFALSAAVKLWLYFRAFGVTSLRLQGAWGILVLSAGCVCWLIWLWTGRKTARFWCALIGITLTITLLV